MHLIVAGVQRFVKMPLSSFSRHLSWKNNGILRTDREISRYTVHTVTKVPLNKSRLGCGLLLSPAKSINGWLTRHQLL